jgi:hypothetical protein
MHTGRHIPLALPFFTDSLFRQNFGGIKKESPGGHGQGFGKRTR